MTSTNKEGTNKESTNKESRRTGINYRKKFLWVSGWIEIFVGLILAMLGLSVISLGWSFLGIIIVLGGITSLGVMIIPEPEIGIRLRFGKAVGILRPGAHLTIPFVDSVKKKSIPYEQLIDIIPLEGELPKVNLHDAVIYLREYVVAIKIGRTFEQIYKAVYGEKDWVDWLRNRLNSLMVGYFRSLNVFDATDGGMLKGNLIDRIEEAEKVAKRRLRLLKKNVKDLKEELEKSDSDKEADVSNPVLEELEEEIDRLTPLPALYKKIEKELSLIRAEALDRGIVNITGIFVGAIKFSKELEDARTAVRTEELKAEAALYKAIQEATGRIGPVIKMKDELQAAGMGDEVEAMRTALAFELADTISKHGGAWALALAQSQEKGGVDKTIPTMLIKWLASVTSEKTNEKTKTTKKEE